MNALTDADQAFLVLLISACLAGCLIRAFWELEQSREKRQRARAHKGAWRR